MQWKCLGLLAVFLATLAGRGWSEVYRQWTELESGRKIEAKISKKRTDSSGVQLIRRDGRAFWIDTEKLVEADRKYVSDWVEPVKHLTVRLAGSGKGYKKVRVKAVAGSRRLQVKAYRRKGDPFPVTKNLAAGEELEFVFKASSEYFVKAWSEGELVDEESSRKKTGL